MEMEMMLQLHQAEHQHLDLVQPVRLQRQMQGSEELTLLEVL
jgi:hypothetical protein